MYMPEGELQPIEDESSLKILLDKMTPVERRERPVFEKGEVVPVKGAPFRVESIGSHLLTLRPLPRKATAEEGKEKK